MSELIQLDEKTVELSEILASADIKWGDLYVELDALYTDLQYSFALTPHDFLTFARADFAQADARGLVNAVSNAKRAIDCQTEGFVQSLGLDPGYLQTELGKDNLKRAFSNIHTDQPPAFKLLSYLGVVAPRIVQQTRRIRHALEHEYKKPSRSAVSNVIDIAELYLGNCEGVMKHFPQTIILGSDPENYQGPGGYTERGPAKWIYVELQLTDRPSIEVSCRDETDKLIRRKVVRVASTHSSFLPLLKLFFCVRRMQPDDVHDVIADLLQINVINPGRKGVRVKSVEYA